MVGTKALESTVIISKKLGYGDTLVSSNIPGRLRPLDKGESVEANQIAGKADSICAPDKEIDSIKVWVK